MDYRFRAPLRRVDANPARVGVPADRAGPCSVGSFD